MASKRPSQEATHDQEDLSATKRRKRTRKLRPPILKATVMELADSASIRVNSSTADIEQDILLRMKKCLLRANHPATPESEAKAALQLASKLMQKYNVTQAEVLAHETPEAQRKHGGQSIVFIERIDGDTSKPVNHSNYLAALCNAMNCFFDCKAYTSKQPSRLKVVFYGIAENTVAAARALEMVFNLIVLWARPYGKAKHSYCLGIGEELHRTAQREKDEEVARAKHAEEDARKAQIMKEQADDQERLDRLRQPHVEEDEEDQPSGPAIESGNRTPPHLGGSDRSESETIRNDSDDEDEYSEWNGFSDDEDDEPNDSGAHYMPADFDDDEDDQVNGTLTSGDMDEQIHRLAMAMNTTVSPSPAPETEARPSSGTNAANSGASHDDGQPGKSRRDSVQSATSTHKDPAWKSHQQLILFRETSSRIADEWVKEKVGKLKAGRKLSGPSDWRAFNKGVQDSKKIDVRRQTIDDEPKHDQYAESSTWRVVE